MRSAVRWVDFTEPISGLAALEQSGLDITVADTSFGPAVCAIEGVGCPADNCFCDANRYWAYSYADGADWQSYPVGASQSVISTTGAIEGWFWGGAEDRPAPAAQAMAAASALEWLRSQQDPAAGGFGDSVGGAVEVMMALGANDESMASWLPPAGKRTLADFVRGRATRFSRQGVGEASKLAVATVAAGGCRTQRSLQPSAYFSPTLGAYANDNGFNAWGILGAAALGEAIPASASAQLASQLQPDGGWEWQAGFGTDVNTTALAVQALVAAGYPVTATEIVSGLAYLKRGQQADGGFVYDAAKPEQGSDANSTAYAVQAILAAGQDPNGEAWAVDGVTPIAYLLSMQLPDGSFEWQPGTGANLLATAQAVPALLGRSYPLASGKLESCIKVAK